MKNESADDRYQHDIYKFCQPKLEFTQTYFNKIFNYVKQICKTDA